MAKLIKVNRVLYNTALITRISLEKIADQGITYYRAVATIPLGFRGDKELVTPWVRRVAKVSEDIRDSWDCDCYEGITEADAKRAAGR